MGQDPAPEDITRLSRVVSIGELPLRLVRDASARPYSPDTGSGDTSSRFNGHLALRDALSAHTLDLIRARQADGAADSLVSRVKLLRDFNPASGAFAAFIKAICVGDLAADVPILLARLAPSENSLDQLQQALRESYHDDEIARLIETDVRQTYLTLESMATGRRVGTPRIALLGRPGLRHLIADGLETAQDAIVAARLPWPERLHALDRLEDRYSPVASFLALGAVRGRTGQPSGWQMADQASEAAVRIASGIADVRVLLAAVHVERHRRATGSLPNTLETAGVQGETAVDPFSGKPFRYIREGDGYIVYSLGRDFRDDGGRVIGEPNKGQVPEYAQSPDIGVRVSR